MLTFLVYHLLRAQPDAVKVAAMTEDTQANEPEPPPTRDELLESLRNLNARAKEISRRGYVGLMSAEHKRRHADINGILDQLVGR